MPNQPSFMQLDLNLEQWRQDIQTFSDSTQHELNEITDQLSATLAGSNSRGSTSTSHQVIHSNDVKQNECSDDRLSKLKRALEKRIK